MNKKEADRILQLNKLLWNRDQDRIFGNIDTSIKSLSISEVLVLSMTGIESLFERDDVFYKRLKK